ncbi:hypothetical protein MNB_SUP05-SYMBIONT-4-20 [hydrothermal vent metagenome]|uniref:Uncharacterized protein n=1 Tax=hydrothermal vent metagenome TaxID=652676 RepID=A0A1W1DV68_9ZZZZ
MGLKKMKYHLIHKNSIDTVLDKARQYRSLLEPDLAISICLDIFLVDPENQEALVGHPQKPKPKKSLFLTTKNP